MGKYNTLIQVLARNIFLGSENEPIIPEKNVASEKLHKTIDQK